VLSKLLEDEFLLEGDEWSANETPKLVPSSEFTSSEEVNRKFSISFSNEHKSDESHYHKHRNEIYYSEKAFEAEYRVVGDTEINKAQLKEGGLIVFAPQVIHKLSFEGQALVISFPSVSGDKVIEDL